MARPQVAILMGSISDLEIMMSSVRVLRNIGVGYEVKVMSAHRSPDAVRDYASGAAERGIQVIIAGAGGAAHLAGALAAHAALPIIGVPLVASALNGWDSLLATVQMPGGVPVATVGVGNSGAVNAGHLAARILALNDPVIADRVAEERKAQAEKVEATQQELQQRLAKEGL